MNKVIMTNSYLGKKGVDLKITAGEGKSVASFSIAVKKDFKDKEYNYFNCVLWGKQGEWLSENQDRISTVNVEGRLETRTYDGKDGTKKYVTEIICNHVEVAQWKKESDGQANTSDEDMIPVNDGDIPF